MFKRPPINTKQIGLDSQNLDLVLNEIGNNKSII